MAHGPLSLLLLGIGVGSLVVSILSVTFLRKWMTSSAVDSQLVEALVSRLAKTDRELMACRKDLDAHKEEVEALRSEKLHNWGIPDEC